MIEDIGDFLVYRPYAACHATRSSLSFSSVLRGAVYALLAVAVSSILVLSALHEPYEDVYTAFPAATDSWDVEEPTYTPVTYEELYMNMSAYDANGDGLIDTWERLWTDER